MQFSKEQYYLMALPQRGHLYFFALAFLQDL